MSIWLSVLLIEKSESDSDWYFGRGSLTIGLGFFTTRVVLSLGE